MVPMRYSHGDYRSATLIPFFKNPISHRNDSLQIRVDVSWRTDNLAELANWGSRPCDYKV